MDSVLLYETKLIIFVFPQRQFLLFTQTISCTVGDCSSLGCCVMDSIVPGQVGQGAIPFVPFTLSHLDGIILANGVWFFVAFVQGLILFSH